MVNEKGLLGALFHFAMTPPYAPQDGAESRFAFLAAGLYEALGNWGFPGFIMAKIEPTRSAANAAQPQARPGDLPYRMNPDSGIIVVGTCNPSATAIKQ